MIERGRDSAGGVLDEFALLVRRGPGPGEVAAAQVAAQGVVVGGAGRGVPEVAVVQQDVAALGVDGDLTADLLESQRHGERRWGQGASAGGAGSVGDGDVVDVLVGGGGGPEVAARDDAQEAVVRAGRVDVQSDGRGGPDVHARARLPVGVPADAGVAGL